jgi:transposase
MAQRPKHRPKSFSTINPYAAGIDIGATHHVVAVDAGRDPTPVRTFRTFSGDLHALADWLHSVGITTVAIVTLQVSFLEAVRAEAWR